MKRDKRKKVMWRKTQEVVEEINQVEVVLEREADV